MSLKNKFFIVFSVCLLTACGHYSEDLAALDNPAVQDIEPAGGADFLTSLSGQYLALAKSENDEAMDYQAAKYFTQKAKLTRIGKFVPPAMVKEFNVPEDKIVQAQELRARLVKAIETQNTFENANKLAKAQAQYDSWLERLDDGHEEAGVAQEIEATLLSLSDPQADEVNYTLYFEPHQTDLGAGSAAKISEIAEFFTENPYYEVTVIGYTDGVAAEDASGTLATNRALSVRQALIDAGIPGFQIRVYREGEQAAFTPVADGTDAAFNRRASVILSLQDNRLM